jgi:hypothetical protein
LARPGKAQASEDLWHLSIDDLFASPAEAATGPVTGPFVINLSLSTAPSGAMPRGMPRFERLCVYQLKRKADGREEFRLRLGIIQTELEADAILAAVREHYPAARKETASEEDATAVKTRAARAAMRLEQAKKAQARMQQAAAAVAARQVAPRSPKAKAAPSAPTARSAPPTPTPSAPPSAPHTWNVDEVLPQFAALAPVKCDPVKHAPVSKPGNSTAVVPAAGAPATAAPAVTPAAAAQSPQTPVTRKSAQPSQRARPAKRAPVPNRAQPPGARAPHRTKPAPHPAPPVVAPTAPEPMLSAPVHVPAAPMPDPVQAMTIEFTPAPASIAAPVSTAPPPPIASSAPIAPTAPPVVESRKPEPAAEIVEITMSAPMPELAPAAVVAVSPPAHDVDSDPNAVTAEVEALTFMIDVPAPTPAREPVVAELELTVEAQHLPPVAIEAPMAQDTIDGSLALESSMTVEAPHITATEAACLEGSITIEAPHITLSETAESAPVAAVATVAAVAADAPRERAFVDTITMEVPALEAAPVHAFDLAPPPSPPTMAVEPVLTETDAVALLEATSPPAPAAVQPARSPEDSGSLERLVARIDSMVEELPAPKPMAMEASAPLSIDSTQTQRALRPLKLPDTESSTNFVVQLILSENEIDPEQVPSLDIFSEYRLYRIMGLDDERVMHALRLGFFSSEPAAQAVAGYLAIFFDSPSVTRVSVAERERFAQERVAARKDVGATGVHSVIELTSPAPLPERRAREALPNTSSTASPKSGSLWSRLVSPLKR